MANITQVSLETRCYYYLKKIESQRKRKIKFLLEHGGSLSSNIIVPSKLIFFWKKTVTATC